MKILLPVLSCVLYLTALVSSQPPECAEALQSCVTVFMENILKHVEQDNSDRLCQDLQVFTKCVFNQKCDIPENQRKAFIENVQKELKTQKFECDIEATQNEADGNNSNGENINRASLFVFCITAMIMFISLKVSH